ncbi:MAG: hypothetical protein H6581_12430 [Bacteroidia bacterium]|nr:hypothetical protein [Bacteroidia bacterium]
MKKLHPFSLLFLWMLIPALIFSQETTNEKILWTADWSPNGKWIAVGGNHNVLRIYSGETFALLNEFNVPNTISQLKWHPKEPLLAIATQISPQKSAILDYNTGKFTFLEGISEAGGRGLDWNRNGEKLAIGDNDGNIIIFGKDGHLIKKVRTSQRAITDLDWHPDGDTLVTVGAHIEVYDLRNNSLKEFVQTRPVEVLLLCVEWHPSGKFLVTGDYGDSEAEYPPLIQFWDVGGQLMRTREGSRKEYRDLTWTSDGNRLVTASDGIRIWSKNGKMVREIPGEVPLWGIDWNPNEQRIVTTSELGEIAIWEADLHKIRVLEYELPEAPSDGPAEGGRPEHFPEK